MLDLSEANCENSTAVWADPKGCYLQKDIGGIWATHEMSRYVLHAGFRDSKGFYVDKPQLTFNL